MNSNDRAATLKRELQPLLPPRITEKTAVLQAWFVRPWRLDCNQGALRGCSQQPGRFDGKVREDAVGAGSLEGQQTLQHDARPVQPAVGCGRT